MPLCYDVSITIGIDDGDVCEREEEDSEEDMNVRRLLRGVASRRNSRRFRPVCQTMYTKNIYYLSCISGDGSLSKRFFMLAI